MTYLGKEEMQTWIEEIIEFYQDQREANLCKGRMADALKAHGAWVVLHDIRFEIEAGVHDVKCQKRLN